MEHKVYVWQRHPHGGYHLRADRRVEADNKHEAAQKVVDQCVAQGTLQKGQHYSVDVCEGNGNRPMWDHVLDGVI